MTSAVGFLSVGCSGSDQCSGAADLLSRGGGQVASAPRLAGSLPGRPCLHRAGRPFHRARPRDELVPFEAFAEAEHVRIFVSPLQPPQSRAARTELGRSSSGSHNVLLGQGSHGRDALCGSVDGYPD